MQRRKRVNLVISKLISTERVLQELKDSNGDLPQDPADRLLVLHPSVEA